VGLFADADNGENTLPKKIRNGEIAQYNFILGMLSYYAAGPFSDGRPAFLLSVVVVGQEELDAKSVNVRNRDDVGMKARAQVVPLEEIVEKLVALKTSRSLENKLVQRN